MYTLVLPLAFVTTWLAIGFGPLALLAGSRPLVARVLLSPAVGIAITSAIAFWLNRIGYPVQSFAAILIVSLIVGSMLIYVCCKPDGPVLSHSSQARGCLLLICILVVGTILIDWPGIKNGLGWLGYANDDMVNYILLGERIRQHGFFDVPAVQDVVSGKDISEFFAVVQERPASQIMLVMMSSFFHLASPSSFMPLLIALNTALAAAVAGLVYVELQSETIAAAVIVAVLANPLNAFSAYSGLLGQTGGITLGAAFLALSTAPWQHQSRALILTAGAVTILLFGILIWYFEFIPVLGAAVGLYAMLRYRKMLNAYMRLSVAALSIATSVYVLCGSYWSTVVRALTYQAELGFVARPLDAIVFPYFLIKAGFASFWGLTLISDVFFTTIPKYSLVLAALLFAFAAISIGVALYERLMIGAVTLVMTLLALSLLHKSADFGVFKAGLYLQPFMAALLAAYAIRAASMVYSYACDSARSYTERRAAFIVLCGITLFATATLGLQMRSLVKYGVIAAGDPSTAEFNELPGSSQQHLLDQLSGLSKLQDGTTYVVDSYNPVLTKMILYYTRGTATKIISRDPFKLSDFAAYFEAIVPKLKESLKGLKPIEMPFEWASSKERDLVTLQVQQSEQPHANDVLLATRADNTVLNRLSLGYPSVNALSIRTFNRVSNLLSFLPTNLSRSYFDYDFAPEKFREVRSHVAIWPNEPDYFYPKATFAGVGRYIMLNLLNPLPDSRVLIEITASFLPQSEYQLPPVQVVAAENVALGTLGRGSARLYSPTVVPVKLGNLSVIGVDMGVDGRQNAASDGKVILDARWLAGYVRDISLVSEDDYRTLKRPSYIDQFPVGLSDKGLEYSGLFEDGWMSEKAFLRLAGPDKPCRFTLHGISPWASNPSEPLEVKVAIDGKEKAHQTLQQGDFDISFNLEPSAQPIQVNLMANRTMRLGPQDARMASFLIRKIGWVAK